MHLAPHGGRLAPGVRRSRKNRAAFGRLETWPARSTGPDRLIEYDAGRLRAVVRKLSPVARCLSLTRFQSRRRWEACCAGGHSTAIGLQGLGARRIHPNGTAGFRGINGGARHLFHVRPCLPLARRLATRLIHPRPFGTQASSSRARRLRKAGLTRKGTRL